MAASPRVEALAERGVDAATTLLNGADTFTWNHDKGDLLDLDPAAEAAGPFADLVVTRLR